MDIKYILNGISFVWDANKAQINSRNHGVTFEQAAEAFFDPFLRIVDASPPGRGSSGCGYRDGYALEFTFCRSHLC